MNILSSGNAPQQSTGGQVWYTSDTHFGHKNIIRYCDRPFRDTDHMDEAIIERWNSVVHPEDTVIHLGDIALGDISKSLPKIARLNGYKIAVLGNHDRPFMKSESAGGYWWNMYANVFQEVQHWSGFETQIEWQRFWVSHFPYTGDHTPTDRHSDKRPVDNGLPLIHGHTHTKDKVTHSSKGTPQIHVGMDAWDFCPVSEYTIIELLG